MLLTSKQKTKNILLFVIYLLQRNEAISISITSFVFIFSPTSRKNVLL